MATTTQNPGPSRADKLLENTRGRLLWLSWLPVLGIALSITMGWDRLIPFPTILFTGTSVSFLLLLTLECRNTLKRRRLTLEAFAGELPAGFFVDRHRELVVEPGTSREVIGEVLAAFERLAKALPASQAGLVWIGGRVHETVRALAMASDDPDNAARLVGSVAAHSSAPQPVRPVLHFLVSGLLLIGIIATFFGLLQVFSMGTFENAPLDPDGDFPKSLTRILQRIAGGALPRRRADYRGSSRRLPRATRVLPRPDPR